MTITTETSVDQVARPKAMAAPIGRPLSMHGGPVLRATDLHHMAWHMHYDEHMSWEQIAVELEGPLAAVERMSAVYQRLTDTAATETEQHVLF